MIDQSSEFNRQIFLYVCICVNRDQQRVCEFNWRMSALTVSPVSGDWTVFKYLGV